jgi:hypothetical protein
MSGIIRDPSIFMSSWLVVRLNSRRSPGSFFTIPNKSEGFQTSWNDSQDKNRNHKVTPERISGLHKPLTIVNLSGNEFCINLDFYIFLKTLNVGLHCLSPFFTYHCLTEHIHRPLIARQLLQVCTHI